MESFTYHNPTRLHFGRGRIAQLSQEIHAQSKVLLLYGQGSIRRNGVYDAVMAALPSRTVLEFGGIEPNPEYDTCMKAVELARREQADFLLSVGGGSVLDGVKFIAAATLFAGEPWDILETRAPVRAALPIGAVLTLPATGSEANGYSVMSRRSRQQKLAFASPLVYPKFSILDPETTYSLDARQSANGVVDAFVHVMEQYLTYPVDAALQDRQAEAVLLTLIEQGPKVLAAPRDYHARANVMWAATAALNGHLGCGVPQDWATHMIGHELTAFFGIDHARTLAVVLPALLREQCDGKREKLLQFAARVWGLNSGSEAARMEAAIQAMEHFFEGLGVPTRLTAYQLTATDTLPIVERFRQQGVKLGERQDIDADKIARILARAGQ